MDPKPFTIIARAAWLVLIVWAAAIGAWATTLFHALLFLGSGFLPWLGRTKEEYLPLDTLVSLTFASSLFVSLFLSWDTGLLGFDKVYHLLGGMCLAWFASIWFRGRLAGARYLAAIIGTAVALGTAWELLELAFAFLPAQFTVPFNPLGWRDSALDLVADTLGACAVAWVRKE